MTEPTTGNHSTNPADPVALTVVKSHPEEGLDSLVAGLRRSLDEFETKTRRTICLAFGALAVLAVLLRFF